MTATATAEQPTGQATTNGDTKNYPEAVRKRGISEEAWRTLNHSLFPGANPHSILMVIDYCKARGLDPLKKPCHIVEMDVKNARTGQYEKRDVVMPGIYEYRITAHRTCLYLGHTKPVYGKTIKIAGVEAPESCSITIFRWNRELEVKSEFPVEILFSEVVATKRDGTANQRWSKAPTQMLTKCTEAAGLREAFPEEFGGEPTAEEMEGRVVDAESVQEQPIQPGQRRSEQAGLPPPNTENDLNIPPRQQREVVPASRDGKRQPATNPLVPPTSAAKEASASDDPARPAHIGRVVDLVEHAKGSLVTLDTGFKCIALTEHLNAVRSLKGQDKAMEFLTRAHSHGAEHPRIITGIDPPPDEGAAV